jgi:hypothetical protein
MGRTREPTSAQNISNNFEIALGPYSTQNISSTYSCRSQRRRYIHQAQNFIHSAPSRDPLIPDSTHKRQLYSHSFHISCSTAYSSFSAQCPPVLPLPVRLFGKNVHPRGILAPMGAPSPPAKPHRLRAWLWGAVEFCASHIWRRRRARRAQMNAMGVKVKIMARLMIMPKRTGFIMC